MWTAINELKNDYVYSDTDSVKFLNIENHKNYFEVYNKTVEYKLQTACNFHGIPFADCKPKTIKGIEKLLGVWDFEGIYEKFKTLGAKRYMVKEKNALTINRTGRGVTLTNDGTEFLTSARQLYIDYQSVMEKYGENGIFNAFTNYLYLPPVATAKNILTYIDYETSGEITDYNGIKCKFNAKSGVHFEPSEYHLSLSVLFLKYLQGLKLVTN